MASFPASDPWVVLKFGGTSVSTVDRWDTIVRRVALLQSRGLRVWVVVSALSQVTNNLERAVAEALASTASPGASSSQNYASPSLVWIRETHARLARELGVDAVDYGAIAEVIAELETVLSGVHLTQEASPRLRARIRAYGERMSSMMGRLAMQSRGLGVSLVQARELLTSIESPDFQDSDNDRYLEANVNPCRDPRATADIPAGHVVITQGFVCRNPSGDTCLLGRGGSDTSGALFAAMIGARRLEIWTDVHGLFTADPRDVPNARLIKKLTFREAQELAAMGAKVLHPRCLVPASWAKIPVEIHNTLDAENEEMITMIVSPEEATAEHMSEEQRRRAASGPLVGGKASEGGRGGQDGDARADACCGGGGEGAQMTNNDCQVMAVTRRSGQVLLSVGTFNM